MPRQPFLKIWQLSIVLSSVATSAVCSAAAPTAQQALGLKPVQKDVEYEHPDRSEVKECTLKSDSSAKHSGWQVRGPKGQLLRRFLDTNRDKKIDLWCYFHRGIEVYRDIDADFNGKADQYRWLGTGGSRWGIDRDEDGTVDHWKTISPEEVTAEMVEAIRNRDAGRFETLLLNTKELNGLGLGSAQADDLKQRIQAAKTGFRKYASQQTTIVKQSRWLHFGATRPGVIPQGTDGSSKDLLIYDNVAAVVDNRGDHAQLIVGTLVHVGNGWRVIDLPQTSSGAGFFYTSLNASTEDNAEATVGLNQKMQELLSKLEEIDEQLSSANPGNLSQLNAERAGVLEELADQAATTQERESWTRQFADSVSAATQSGNYPAGVQRLSQLIAKLKESQASGDLQAYVQFRYLTADYGQQMQDPNAKFERIQESWLSRLADYVKQYPKSQDAAEAMLQLGIAQEFAGKEQEAIVWYRRIIQDFGTTRLAEKAAGAKRRLESVGKSLTLQGPTLDGKSLHLDRYRGRAVLIHYWATWCEPCKRDMKDIRELLSELPRGKFAVIGINLDTDHKSATSYVQSKNVNWPQLYEPGGLDSRLATEMGILTLPTMILIDKSGRVVRKNLHAGELAKELEKLTSEQ